MTGEIGLSDVRGAGPLLSVIVPVFNAEATLADQLGALAAETCSVPWEVVVVDDASTDRSLEIAQSYCGRLPLQIVRQRENRGAAAARNAGAAAARGAYLGFLDADDVIAPGWAEAAVRMLEQHDAAGSRFDVETLNPPEVRTSRNAAQQTGLQEYRYPTFLSHCGGSGLMVRKDVHESIGGFDETLRYLEDTDYVWRLQLAGHELAFAHEAVLRVRYRRDAVGTARQAYHYGYHNVVLYARYRSLGMPNLPRRRGLRSLTRLLSPTWLPAVWNVEVRHQWMRRAGWALGRIDASLRHHVWAL